MDLMDLQEQIRTARETGEFAPLLDAIPYACLLGIKMQLDDQGEPLFHLPFAQKNIGNAMLPALHGGVIGGFLENCAILHLMWVRASLEMPKTIDFSIDYLRSGRAQDTYGQGRITRQGKRVAHVHIDAWQSDRATPIAASRVHLLLT